MGTTQQDDPGGNDPRTGLLRVLGSMPWLKPQDKRHYRAKVFKSGNSLAVRIPAGTKLSAGMELELIVEDGEYLSFQPVNPPKRKFNIAKVAGSATQLNAIRDDDRLFEPRPLAWDASPAPGAV